MGSRVELFAQIRRDRSRTSRSRTRASTSDREQDREDGAELSCSAGTKDTAEAINVALDTMLVEDTTAPGLLMSLPGRPACWSRHTDRIHDRRVLRGPSR